MGRIEKKILKVFHGKHGRLFLRKDREKRYELSAYYYMFVKYVYFLVTKNDFFINGFVPFSENKIGVLPYSEILIYLRSIGVKMLGPNIWHPFGA